MQSTSIFLYFLFFTLLGLFCYFFPVKINCHPHRTIGQGGEPSLHRLFILHFSLVPLPFLFRSRLGMDPTEQVNKFTAYNQHRSIGKKLNFERTVPLILPPSAPFCVPRRRLAGLAQVQCLSLDQEFLRPSEFKKKKKNLLISSSFINLFLDVLKPCKFAIRQINK